MKTLSMLASVAIVSVILLSAFASAVRPASATGVTVNIVDISAEVNCGLTGATCSAYHILYDSADGSAWINVGTCSSPCVSGDIYKVVLSSVLSTPASSVTGFTNIFPSTLGSCNSFAGGPFDSTLMGGDIYATAVYGNGIAVGQVRESDGSMLNSWCYTGATSAKGITNDGTYLYVGTSAGILKLTTSGTFSLLASTTSEVNGIVNSGGNLWVVEGGTKCLAEYTSSLTELTCGSSDGTRLILDGSGNFWYTSNIDHTLNEYTGSAFKHYATGITQDGPYGLYATTGGIRVDGYKSDSILFFSTSNSSFVSSDVKTTTKAPYDGFVDSLSNEWDLALGSTDMIQLAPASSTTTVTQTVTSTQTATVTVTVTATSSTLTSTTQTTTTQTSTTTSCTIAWQCVCEIANPDFRGCGVAETDQNGG